MPKNGTLKSLIKGVFIFSILYIGIFSANNCFATVIQYSTEFTNEFKPLDFPSAERGGYLFFSSPATTSLTDISLMQMTTTTPTKSYYIQIQRRDCEDITTVIGGVTNTEYSTLNSSYYTYITYHFASPYSLGYNLCYAIELNGSSETDIYSGYGLTAGLQTPPYTKYLAHSSSGGLTSDYPSVPYFTLWSGFSDATLSIEITNPPASASINTNTPEFWIYAEMDPDQDNLLEYELRENDVNGKIIFSNNYTIKAGTDDDGIHSLQTTVGKVANGTYIYTAKLTDQLTQDWVEASRLIVVNMTNNPVKTNTTAQEEAENKCPDFIGTYDNPLCTVFWYLFDPSSITEERVRIEKENLTDHIPFSWISDFNTALESHTETSTETYVLLPSSIDNIFKWLWYLIFLMVMYKITVKMFK